MKAFIFFVLVTVGYLIAMVVADFPSFPVVVGGVFYATLVFAGVPNKALLMFFASLALVGYHVAMRLADLPLWPIQTFAAACVVVSVVSIARNKLSAGAQPA